MEDCSRLSIECTLPTWVSICFSPSSLSAILCSMSVHGSLHELEFCRIISMLSPISYSRRKLRRTVVDCPSNAHLQPWCLLVPLHHLCLLNFVLNECASIRSRLRILQLNQQPRVQIMHQRHTGDDCSGLSVQCAPSTFVSICSYPSLLSANLCCMSVYRSVHVLKILPHNHKAESHII